MSGYYESAVDRQIREAQERGEFDGLPGSGQPLSGFGSDYDEDWWVKDWVRREAVTGVLPPTLALRREIEDLPATLTKLTDENSVRRVIASVNEKIGKAHRGLLDGPPVAPPFLDEEALTSAWRSRRQRRARSDAP